LLCFLINDERVEEILLEKYFKKGIWQSRLIVILAVLFGLCGALVLFIVASIDIWEVTVYAFNTIINHAHPEYFHEDIVAAIIGAIDLYLIAIVMMIFSFGIYELFISAIDEAAECKILTINNLDQLKDKISKVIIMIMVVSFVKRVLIMEYSTTLDMLYLALSIATLSGAFYLLAQIGEH